MYYSSLRKNVAAVAVIAAAALSAFACAESPVASLPPEVSANPIAVKSVLVSDSGSVVMVGTETEVSATVIGVNGLPLSGRVATWKSSDESVALVVATGNSTASVMAVGPGVAMITASVEGIAGSVSLAVTTDPNAVGGITIDSFAVSEVQYQSAPGFWYYAPLIRIKASAGSRGGDVIQIRLRVPDLGTIECSATRRVLAGETVELFREVYGDFELTIFHGDGTRIPPAVATLEVIVREGGITRELSTTAAVSPGSFPSTYTGGRVDNPWNCFGPVGSIVGIQSDSSFLRVRPTSGLTTRFEGDVR